MLQVLAIRESFSFSTGRAIAVLLIPFAVIVLLSCVGGLLIASLMLNAVKGSESSQMERPELIRRTHRRGTIPMAAM